MFRGQKDSTIPFSSKSVAAYRGRPDADSAFVWFGGDAGDEPLRGQRDVRHGAAISTARLQASQRLAAMPPCGMDHLSSLAGGMDLRPAATPSALAHLELISNLACSIYLSIDCLFMLHKQT